MAGRLLRYANAVHGGSRRHIASLTQAVTFLGLYRIRQLALAFSLVDAYRNGRCRSFDYERYWSQSLATGVGAQVLSRLAEVPADESFTCGLLSGIGRLGFASAFPGEYATILAPLSRSACHGAELRQAESRAFGLDHLQLAAEMLNDWGLPSIFVEAVRHHEDPDAAPFAASSRVENLAHVLHLAAAMARLLVDGVEHAHSDDGQALYHAAARVGLDAGELAPTLERVSDIWADWGQELKLPTPRHAVSDLLLDTPAVESQAALVVLPMRVALIAADRALLDTLGAWLARLGQETLFVGDWAQAAASVHAHLPDVLLVDATNQSGDPLQRIRDIRCAEAPHHGFFIALTRPEDEARMPEFIRAGVDDFLPLPPTPAAFEARLHAAQRVVVLQGAVRAEREAAIRHSSEWARSNRRLLHEALTDPLTQLPNRRYGMDHLTQECAFAGEAKLPLAVMMLDIDHFKRVNDRYGHEAGDDVLRQVSARVLANCRKNDVVFRYGGEEFCVICPATTAADALGLAERILVALRDSEMSSGGHSLLTTISAGIAVRRPGLESAERLIAAADAALYRAKEGGRDRVELDSGGGAEPA
jgi:diguanylate cyclase (GGDEF)-like protein